MMMDRENSEELNFQIYVAVIELNLPRLFY